MTTGLLALPVAPLPGRGPSQAAQASVAEGDMIVTRAISSSNADHHVGVLSANGNTFTQISYGGDAFNAAGSANGKRAAFTAYRGSIRTNIWTVNTDGSGPLRVTPNVTSAEANTGSDCTAQQLFIYTA